MTLGAKIMIGVMCILPTTIIALGNVDNPPFGAEFTGETLTLLYVTDVRKSVQFYKALGFTHDYYYDYETDTYTRDWTQPYPPQYAEMVQTGIRIGVTTPDGPDHVLGGGVRHYFIVDDVHRHFEMTAASGIVAVPHEVEHRPWMDFFTVPDPDNHQIVIGTKNQAYYDQAREQVNRLKQPAK